MRTRCSHWLFRFALAGIAFVASTQAYADEFGGVYFNKPAGWEAKQGKDVVILTCPPSAKGEALVVVISRALPVSSKGASSDFSKLIASSEKKAKSKMSEVVESKSGGLTYLAQTAVTDDIAGPIKKLYEYVTDGKLSAFMAVVSQGDKTIAAQEKELLSLATTLKLKTTENQTDQKSDGGNSTVELPPLLGTSKGQTGGSTGNAASQMSALAAQLQDASKDPVPIFTEMARLAGFTIRKEDHTKIADHAGTVDLKLALTDYEIQTFSAMDRKGNGCRLGNLCSAFDSLLKYGKVDIKTLPLVRQWLIDGTLADSKETRMSALFVTLLASRHTNPADTLFNADAYVDPLEALVITRVITSEIAFAAKQKAKPALVNVFPYVNENLLASILPVAPPAASDYLQGWQEDGFVGSVTTLVSFLHDHYGPEGLSNAVGLANLANAIVKFIETYAGLVSSIEVEGGQPLVRTQDMVAGKEKTLVGKVRLDPNMYANWMKDARVVAGFLGFDMDMPQTGALSDVQTAWEIVENGSALKNTGIVQWKENGNPSNVPTNSNGEARVKVEGCAQSKDLDPALIRPAMKSVIVRMTPEVKKNGDVSQDLTDAIFGAMGFKDGPNPAGFIGPLMEYLYRLKWAGTSEITLQVKDWEPNAARVGLHLKINGAESSSKSGEAMQTVQSTIIKRSLSIENLIMTLDEPFERPTIDPQTLSQLPAAQRQQILDTIKQANTIERNYTFKPSPNGPGLVTFNVNDSYGRTTTEDICEKDTSSTRLANVGSLYLPVGASGAIGRAFECTILKSADADEAYIKLEVVTGQATAYEDTQNGKIRAHSEKPTQVFLYDRIRIDGVDPLKGIKVKLTGSNKQADGTFARYDGIATLTFHFGSSMNSKGTAVLTIGMDMPPSKKKKK